jgi:hypothetical protein
VGTLGRPEQAGEERLEAGLRRRCRYQLCVTLEVPGQVGRVDGGKFVVSFAIQSDGVSVVERAGSCSRDAGGAGSAVAAGDVGVGGALALVIAMISSSRSPVGTGRRG